MIDDINFVKSYMMAALKIPLPINFSSELLHKQIGVI